MSLITKCLIILQLTLLSIGCSKPGTYYSGPGPKGDTGAKGDKGEDGQGCTVTPVSPSLDVPNGGALVTCGTESVLIVNGQDAPPSDYAVSEILDPCGDDPNKDDEVFLLLAGGELLWLQSDNTNGKNSRLSLGRDGTWGTTDGTGCVFTISTLGTTRTIEWPGFSKSWEID